MIQRSVGDGYRADAGRCRQTLLGAAVSVIDFPGIELDRCACKRRYDIGHEERVVVVRQSR